MNKTVTANIGGFVFNIDEHAYETLQKYLNAIRSKMQHEEGVDEVMQDIESRIAELFREKLNELKREVINMSDVESIITVMGEPDAYGSGDSANHEKSNDSKSAYEESSNGNHQIFRDPDDKVIGGVCSGLAAYMGWDPIVVRLIFVVLLFGFGTGFLLYVLLWIIVPEARTTNDRLRMRGEKINVENIKEKFKDIKKDMEGSGKETGNKIKRGIHQLVDNFGETFGTLAKVFAIILGSMMLVGAIAILFILIKMMAQSEIIYVFTHDNFYSVTYEQLETVFFNSPAQANIGYIGFVLLLASISTGLILTALRLIFKVKVPVVFKVITGSTAGIGILCIIICSFQVATDFSNNNSYSEQIKINQNKDTLYVEIMDDPYFSENLEYNDDILFETVQLKDESIIFGYPELKIKQSRTKDFEVIIEREAHGSTTREALSRAEAIHYDFSSADSLLTLSPYFSTPVKNKLRLQKITVTVLVPQGKTIHFGNNINRMLSYDENHHNHHRGHHEDDDEELHFPINTYMMMTPNGLQSR